MAATRKSAARNMAMSSFSKNDRRQNLSRTKRTAPVPRTSCNPPGLAGIHWLANRVLVVSLLVSAILCVLELQARLNVSRTYTALQDARTMQKLVMDSRAQLMAALGSTDASEQTNQSDLSSNQKHEPLVLPPSPKSSYLKSQSLLENLARWIKAGPVLRGY